MLKLRTILLYNYPYYIFLIIVLLISIPRLLIPKVSNYKETTNSEIGIITNITKTKNNLKIIIKNKEKLLVYYKIKPNSNITLELGDKIKVEGLFTKPKANTTKNLFNYQNYLYNKNIHYIVIKSNITVISKNKNIFYKIKQLFINRTKNSPYLKAFILGDKSLLSQNIITSYQENGISHLLAISGMHISLLSSIILKILKQFKIKENMRYLITSLLLLLYLLILGLSPSALRGVLFFILFSINKVYYFYIKPVNIFIVGLSLTLLINPFYIYDIGFQYSFIISLTLIIMSSIITGNYLQKLLKTSTIAFLVSIPISLYNYYQINLLSIIYNLFFVPLVSIIIFPLSLITFIIKPLEPLYNITIKILEETSLFLSNINFGKLIFPKLNIIVYLIYYVLIILIFKNINKPHIPISILILLLLIHYIYPTFIINSSLTMIDVGQGDSLLIQSRNESVLIDTGGSMFTDKDVSKYALTTTIPLLKSRGIRKLKYLILTHGDADHMKEANFILDNFKVEKVIINQGYFNYLERNLINKYDNIYLSKQDEVLTCGDMTLQQLNKEFFNENDSSQVYLGIINNIKIIFMGDASCKTENYLLEKYDLGEINILKVGHHGSDTSSCENFIEEINPKTCLISDGVNNKFGHPKKSVLNTLNKYCDIYRTDLNGTVTIKFKDNNYNIFLTNY